MFKLEDLDELYDKFMSKEKRFTVNGIGFSLIESDICTMLIRSDIYDKAFDEKLKQEIEKYERLDG